MASLDYRSIKDIYDTLHDAGVVTETLPEWSAKQNQLTNSDLYAAGLHDDWIKRFSVGLDRTLEETGFPKITGRLLEPIGELFGAPEVVRKIGEGIPRSIVNLASFAIPGGGWANAARLGIAGLLSGAETYTETGSPAAGVLAGGTFAALPGAIAPVERAVLARTGSRFLAGTVGQAAAATGIEASRFGQDVITGQPLHNPASVETLLNLTLGQAPFAALHLGGKLIRGEGSVEQHAVDAANKVVQPPPKPKVFPDATPEQLRETGLQLAQLRGEQVSLDPTNVDEANNLLQQEHEVLKQHIPQPNSVFGDSIQPETPRQQVIGHELKSTGKWRAVLVSDSPVNPEELRGKVVGYSTGRFEPNPVARSTGDTVFSLPPPQWQTVKSQEEWNARGKPVGPANQPDLPNQENFLGSMTDEQVNAQLQDLQKVNVDADTSQTLADLQRSVVRLQGVQHDSGISPTNDATIKPRVEKLAKTGEVPPSQLAQTAVKVEANRTARKIQSTREKERAVPRLTSEEAAKVGAMMGQTVEGRRGFDIITADKLSHNVEDVAATGSQEGRDIVTDAAYTVTESDLATKKDAVDLFRTIVEQTGIVPQPGSKSAMLDDVAQFIHDRDGTHLPEVKDEIKALLAGPDAKVWGRKLEAHVALMKEENSAPGNVIRPPPGERLVTVQRADGSTFQASFGDKYYEGGRASVARLTPEGKWSHTVLSEGDKIVEQAKSDNSIVKNPVYHQTPHEFPLTNFHPFSHFGSLEAAKSVWGNWKKDVWEGVKNPKLQLHSVELNIQNPIRLIDEGQTTTPEFWAGYLRHELVKKGFAKDVPYSNEGDYGSVDKQDWSQLISEANRAGYDGIVYKNEGEDGGDSYIIFDKSQVIPIKANRAPAFEPFIPDNPQDVVTVESLGLDRGGTGLNDYLQKSSVPLASNFSKKVAGLTDSLARTEVVVGETKSGNSATFDLGNGNTQIVITPATLDKPTRDFTITHELSHGLTIAELNNPAKADIVKELDDIREQLIQKLPKAQQNRVRELIATEWTKKYSAGAPFASMFPEGTAAQQQVMYALLNTKEMVSQSHSSEQMQNWTKKIQLAGGSAWTKLVDMFRRLLGLDMKNSAYEAIVQKTDALLEQGNYVSSFRNFSDRYFENLGLTGSLVQGQTRRALGIVLDSSFGTSREDIIGRLGNDVSVRSPEVTTAKRDLNNTLQGEAKPEFEQFMGELGFEPSVKGFDDFVHEALNGRVANHQDALDVMPTEASRYVFAKVKDMQNVLGVLRAATAEANKGLINLADPAALRGPIKDALKAVDRIAQVQKVHELGSQLINESMALQPDVFVDRMESAPDVKTLEDFGNEDPKKKLGGLSYFLGQAARIAKRFPVTAELIDRGYELGANSATMKGNVLKVLGIDLSKPEQGITKDGLATSVKAISSPRTLNAVNRWMYWSNKVALDKQEGVTMLPDSHPEVAKLLAPLTEKERNDVIDTVTKRSVSNQVLQAETLEKMHQIGVALGAHITMKDGNVKTADAMQITGQLFDALRADRSNPQLAQQADAQIALVQSKMSPEGFLELIKNMQSTLEQFKGWEAYFKQNPDWSTAQRLERYLVSFTRGNNKKQLQASSVKEANVIAEGGKHIEIVDQWKGREDEFPTLGPDVQGLFQRLSELEQNQLRSLQSKGYLDEQGLADFQRMSIATQLARETAGQQPGVPKFEAPPRLLSQGAEELPWFWNHIAHAERTSNYWSRKLFRIQASLHLADPDMVANPTLQKWSKQHVENMLQPDPSFTQKVSRLTSTWFMGFAPASAMMNGFQTISTAVPEMTLENGGRMIDAYGKWGRAVAEVSKESLPRGEWSTDEHKWLSKQMSEAHEWDFSMYSDEAYTQEAASTNFRRMMMKQKPQTIGQRLGTLVGNYSTAGMWMFKSVERFNNKVASVMAFDHYRAEGLSREDALVEAKRFNRAVNYSGGRANRPVGVFSGSSDFGRSAAMLATNMQGYNLGVVGQIADYLQRGFFRPEGITPAEVYSARKAGLQMLGTQIVAAGALGLPFVSGTVALINQLFPDLEINRHIREWAKGFFDGDKENGGTLGDIALTGLPSMVGWDMQSRLSIGNVVPGTSEYNGFQPETLLGPPVNMIASWINGAKRVATGDPKGGEAFVPPGVKKLFQLAVEDGKLKDYRDRPLFTPTVGETAGIALGFNPKRLSDFNAASRIESQNQDVARRKEGQFHQTQAEDVLRGNFGTVRQTLLQRASTDKTFDPQAAVKSVAAAAEDLTFPRDLRREGTLGTSGTRARLLSTFNLPPSAPSEVDRANFRLQIEQRLGLRVDPRRELRVAQMVDKLQRQNPTATRSELRRKVAGMLRTTPRNESLLPESP